MPIGVWREFPFLPSLRASGLQGNAMRCLRPRILHTLRGPRSLGRSWASRLVLLPLPCTP